MRVVQSMLREAAAAPAAQSCLEEWSRRSHCVVSVQTRSAEQGRRGGGKEGRSSTGKEGTMKWEEKGKSRLRKGARKQANKRRTKDVERTITESEDMRFIRFSIKYL